MTEEKYSIPPPEKHGHDEDLVSLFISFLVAVELSFLLKVNKVKELEEALEVYYAKYKAQKIAKQTLRDVISHLDSCTVLSITIYTGSFRTRGSN